MTITVAVTGGIGAGKSTVSGMLAARGAVVVDSDRLARDVVGVGTPGLSAIEGRFGAGVLAEDGSLDRAALATIVFADAEARKDLEGITHPLVRARFEALRAAAPAGGVVVNDIPLLTTIEGAAAFHLVVGVGAPERVRVERLVVRGLTEGDAQARIAAQINDTARRALCDLWIDNSGAPGVARRQADRLWSRLSEFAANVEAGRVAPEADGVIVAVADWSGAAARLTARVRRIVGERPLRPVGSTARPGGTGPDRIELEVTAADRAQVEAWLPALAAAGYPRRRSVPAPSGPGRLDVVLGSADSGQRVNLYFTVG